MAFSIARGFSCIALAVLSSCSGSDRDLIGGVLPLGEVQAHVLESKMSAEMNSIILRFRASLSVNAEWFLEYARGFPDADPSDPLASALPYHENFGVREEEYEQLLEAIAQGMRSLEEGEPVTLQVSSFEERARILGEGPAAGLNGIIFDLEADRIETPWGTLAKPWPKSIAAESGGMGPFEGQEWYLAEGDSMSAILKGEGVAKSIRIMLGERNGGTHGALYAQLRVVKDGEALVNETIALQWEL